MMNGQLTFLRREPALWLAAIQSVLTIIVGFSWSGLNATQAALWISLVNAVIAIAQAILTRPVAPTVFTNAFAVAATLLAAYGLHLSQEMVASINAAIISMVILVARAQISPAPDASRTGVLGNKVVTEGL
jgi:hypothetical protein